MILAWIAALASDPGSLAGFYRSTAMEVGAAIEIDPDGSFAYALDYGAVSETAEGRWTRQGAQLLLTPTKTQGTALGEPLNRMTIDASSLILQRYDRDIRFEREGDPAPPPDRNQALQKGN